MKDSKDQMVTLDGDHPTTNTLIIAEHFGKKHQHVMRDIRELIAECPEEFGLSNFGQTPYYDSQGKKQTMYSLTRDGFMLLSMGFTGSNATRLKIAFIEEFSRMEAALHQPTPRPGQVESLQMERMKEALLAAYPAWKKIKRYFELGLTQKEIGRLIRRSESTVRRHLDKMTACCVINRTINPLLSAYGKRGNQKRLSLVGEHHV